MYRWVIAGTLCAALAACGTSSEPAVQATADTWLQPPVATSPATEAPAKTPPKLVTYPAHGTVKWLLAPGQQTPIAGTGGRLLRYRVAVERDIKNLSTPAFA